MRAVDAEYIKHYPALTNYDGVQCISVDVYHTRGGINTVVSAAHAADVGYFSGTWGSRMYIQAPTNKDDLRALFDLLVEMVI